MSRFRRSITRFAPFAVLLLVALAALALEPGFYNPSNLRNVARGAAFLSVVALGQLLVVVVRGLDLSVGAVITATLLLIVQIAGTQDGRLLRALVAVVAMAVAIGALNAFLVVIRRVPAILATLATYFLVQGVGLWLTEGRSRGRVPDELRPGPRSAVRCTRSGRTRTRRTLPASPTGVSQRSPSSGHR
jgi:ribose transport system permease protein